MQQGLHHYQWGCRGFESRRFHSRDRSSEVERHCLCVSRRCLAAHAQTAGLLTGNEDKEGENPSGGSLLLVDRNSRGEYSEDYTTL
jgi:hypothetical protein